MLNTWIIILIMVAFIGGIVAYAYGGEKYREYKETAAYKAKIKKAKEKERLRNEEMAARQLARDEKYRAARERSQFIQKELKRLELLKRGLVLEEE